MKNDGERNAKSKHLNNAIRFNWIVQSNIGMNASKTIANICLVCFKFRPIEKPQKIWNK